MGGRAHVAVEIADCRAIHNSYVALVCFFSGPKGSCLVRSECGVVSRELHCNGWGMMRYNGQWLASEIQCRIVICPDDLDRDLF